MRAAAHRHALKPDAVFHAEDRGQTKQGLGEVGFNLIEHGFAQSGGNSLSDNRGGSANRISLFAALLDQGNHLRSCCVVWTADDIGTAICQRFHV